MILKLFAMIYIYFPEWKWLYFKIQKDLTFHHCSILILEMYKRGQTG